MTAHLPADAAKQTMRSAPMVSIRSQIRLCIEKGVCDRTVLHRCHFQWAYIFRYVQMLERQHSQLIAGVHEMYKLLRKGEDWPTSMLGLLSRNDGQPLTHQILEALGVLHTLPQEDADDPDEQWQTFEHHPLDDGIVNTSTTTSPITHSLPPPQVQTPKQPAAPPRLMIAERRRSKFETDPLAMEQYNSAISPFTTSTPYLKQGPPFSANVAYTTQRHQESFPTPFSDQQLYDETITFGGNTPGKGDVMALDWTGVVDLFDSNPTMAESMQTG